jgi:hypothetical protein
MPVKPNFNPEYLYFVTTTALKHMHLFRRDVIKRIIVASFHHLRTTDKMKLFVQEGSCAPHGIVVLAAVTHEDRSGDSFRHGIPLGVIARL